MPTLSELTGEIAKNLALENDRRVTKALIGSTITGFTIKPIPNRSTLYKMTIETDCDRVLLADPHFPDGFTVLGEKFRRWADLSKIEVTVKIK